MDKLFLLDAYAIIFRSYYAFIKRPTINSRGLNTSTVLGFCNTRPFHPTKPSGKRLRRTSNCRYPSSRTYSKP